MTNDIFETAAFIFIGIIALGIMGVLIFALLPYLTVLLVIGTVIAVLGGVVYLIIFLAVLAVESLNTLVQKIKSWFNA